MWLEAVQPVDDQVEQHPRAGELRDRQSQAAGEPQPRPALRWAGRGRSADPDVRGHALMVTRRRQRVSRMKD